LPRDFVLWSYRPRANSHLPVSDIASHNIRRLRPSHPIVMMGQAGESLMRVFRILAIVMALVMLISGSVVCCAWIMLDGSLPIPLASAALASLGAAVLLLEFQDREPA
jgi:hypothetical protein